MWVYMLFLIVLQLVVAVLIVVLVLCQSSGSGITGTFTPKRSDVFAARSGADFFVRVTWVLLFVFFVNTVLLGRLNFSSNTEVITSELEERELKRALESDYSDSEVPENVSSN